ncbi:Hypothetical predicted protein [Podarcis lilfordi]|uniref:Uncharacterized protein n=1 Tax=Podarcis lilfordi TaxID=74358 RepID=A0AA35LMD1_9SAUR|nr:Hypothetical predicted protein [Podarcis lilfordi]
MSAIEFPTGFQVCPRLVAFPPSSVSSLDSLWDSLNEGPVSAGRQPLNPMKKTARKRDLRRPPLASVPSSSGLTGSSEEGRRQHHQCHRGNPVQEAAGGAGRKEATLHAAQAAVSTLNQGLNPCGPNWRGGIKDQSAEASGARNVGGNPTPHGLMPASHTATPSPRACHLWRLWSGTEKTAGKGWTAKEKCERTTASAVAEEKEKAGLRGERSWKVA